MNNNDQGANDMKETLLKELQKELDNEMEKSFSQRDTDRIEELTDMIYSLEFDEQGEAEIEGAKERLIGKVTTNAPVRRSVIRRFVPAAACAAILLGINQVSLSAYGENIFSRIYHYTGKGVAIHLEENPDTDTMPTGSSVITGTDIELSISESDPYGIKKKCAEYGIYPLTPSYIPKGFKLTEIETENDIKANAIRFSFVKGDETIELEYAQYKTDKMSVEIPSTSTNIIEKEICGRVFATIQEENSTKAFCADDVLLYGVFIDGIDRQESDKILNSLS